METKLGETTVRELIDVCRESNAGHMEIKLWSKEKGKLLALVVVALEEDADAVNDFIERHDAETGR